MAQTQSPTNAAYAEIAKLCVGEAADAWTHIALDEANCSGYSESTTALTTESAKSGLTRAAATMTSETTTVTDDTAQATHEFTAGQTATITGFAVFNAASAGDMLMWCCFASGVSLESSDKLTCTGKVQFKKAA